MILYILKRILAALPTLLVLVTLCFFMMRMAPGGPFDLEQQLDPAIEAQLLAQYQLDKPLWQQYLYYLKHLAQGDLGTSFKYKDRSVNQLIKTSFPVSLKIGGTALLLSLLLGLPIGMIAAVKQNSTWDHVLMTFSLEGITLPTFVTAPLLVMVFALLLKWLPAGGWGDGNMVYLILPIVALTIPHVAVIARLMRGSLLEVLSSPFIRTAYAKGLSTRQVILKHALRPAILPLVSYLGPTTAGIITGSIIIEQIFTLPGLGTILVQAAINRDYTSVLGIVVLLGALMVFFNLLVDLIYAWLDPRIRYGSHVKSA